MEKKESPEVMRKRLRYQSWHRGCKETDVILGRFCDQHLEELSADELLAFDAILKVDDADLYRWITGEQPIPKEWQESHMLKRVIAFDVSAHA